MDFLTCKICIQNFQFNIPKVLNCGHTICDCCVKKCNDICPTCRSKIESTNTNYEINYVFTEVDSFFKNEKKTNGRITSFDFIIPNISYYVSDATKKLKAFLQLSKIPDFAIDYLLKNSNEDFWPKNFENEVNRITNREFIGNLNVIISEECLFRIKSREEIIEQNECKSRPTFYYNKYYSSNKILNDEWRNYYRRNEDGPIIETKTNYFKKDSEVKKEEKTYERKESSEMYKNDIVACLVLFSDNRDYGSDFNKNIGFIFWLANPTFVPNKFQYNINQHVKLGDVPYGLTGNYNDYNITTTDVNGLSIIRKNSEFWALSETYVNAYYYF